MAVLTVIMGDRAVVPIARVLAANAILAWSAPIRAAQAEVTGKTRSRPAGIEIEWSDPVATRR